MSPGAPGLLLRPGLVRGLGTLRSQFTAATGTFSPCSWEVPGQPPHPLYWLSWGRRTPPRSSLFPWLWQSCDPRTVSLPGLTHFGKGAQRYPVDQAPQAGMVLGMGDV